MHKTAEYRVWRGMLTRCTNPNSKDWPSYGGRGIRVARRWRSFENFLADVGNRPSSDHQLERKENDGPYSKKNCRWATRSEQQCNRRNNRMLTLRGESLPIAEWARRLGLSWDCLWSRVKREWSEEKILAHVPLARA
jgi:hypothetical protein